MRTFLFIFMLLAGVIGAHAQPDDWQYVGDDYSGTEHLVYVGLVDGNGGALMPAEYDWLGAFIDGECRGAVMARHQQEGQATIAYFPIRIKGFSSDNGKKISFRYCRRQSPDNYYFFEEYDLSGSQTLTYQDGATTGMPSAFYTLTYVQPVSFSFPERLEVKVGDSLDLMSQFKWTPANASKPVKIEWECGNFISYMSAENGWLKGLKPVDNAFLNFNQLEGIKSENGLYYTFVKVVQPITDLKLNDWCLNGDTVYVGDSTSLTYILRNCYTVLPADANETLTWSWEDEDAFTYNTNSAHWTPNKAGRYKLTLTGGSHSIVLPLTVFNYVDDIMPTVKEIHLFKGDNLSTLLPYAVEFTPSEMIDTELSYTVSSDDGVLAYNNQGEIIAMKEGDAGIYVRLMRQQNKQFYLPVYVHPNVTAVNIKNNVLSYEYNAADSINISSDVAANFSFAPDTAYQVKQGEIASDNINVCSVIYPNPNGTWWGAFAKSLGSATITVNHSAERTTLTNAGHLTTSTVTAAGKFVVTVVEGLSSFTFDPVVMGRDEMGKVVLTPKPIDATVDGSKIRVEIINDNLPQGWTLATLQSSDDTGLNWVVTPKAVGRGYIVVYYDGKILSRNPITIGQSFTQKAGWMWVTPYGGSVKDLSVIYGKSLEEMRSQTELMFNDPVYGYFGDLTSMYKNECYKVKVKEGQAVIAFNSEVDYTSDVDVVSLGNRWSWVGFPYQFDHALTDALTANFTSGDRIVSKENGFAEYDGTSWTGTLTTLTAGEGYLFYNASGEGRDLSIPTEAVLGQPEQTNPSGAKAGGLRSGVWQYNGSRFASNMTIIADLGTAYASNRYTIGAFVGDECRGEGMFIGGKWFITVHGDETGRGQQVSFRLYDTMTGTSLPIENELAYAQTAGTLRAPLRMTVGAATGISSITQEHDGSEGTTLYTIDGKHVAPANKPAAGIYIQRHGKSVRKVVVK